MKVLIVDDSIIFRKAIKTSLTHIKKFEIEFIKTASNGKIAVDFLKQQKFDVVTLDIEMPEMDGLQAIQEIRKFDKDVIIILFSGVTLSSANKTLKALELGANDFIQKPSCGSQEKNMAAIDRDLIPRVESLMLRRIEKMKSSTPRVVATTPDSSAQPKVVRNKSYMTNSRPQMICIGSSTGGPEALKKLFRLINKDVKAPIVIVQHMPPVFTKQLAGMLNDLCPLEVVEGEDGMKVESGKAVLAPGDYHMEVKKIMDSYHVSLNQNEKVCFVRPAVDVTLWSLAKNVVGKVLTIVLTGMGDDGTDGARSIKSAGGVVLVQDKESSVVWGMPGSIAKNEIEDDILTIEELAEVINKLGA